MPIRSNIQKMAGYMPGEQPRDSEVVKLNTNENPYPPSPRVREAILSTLTGAHLRKYPEPTGHAFRSVAGHILGIDPDAILVGNGSDDILTIITRAFVPEHGLIVSPAPSYILYRSLAEIQGARFQTFPYAANWQLPETRPLPEADLTFVANPNSPSGTFVSIDSVKRFAEQSLGPVVLDEAYVDFAETDGLHLAGKSVIVTRSLSKSYALAGIRFGFAVADPALIQELLKVKDSYNCDVLSQAAATAAFEDQEYLNQIRVKIIATRQRMTQQLQSLGFEVTPSQANFVWCRRTDRPVKPIYETLKARKLLVRYMNYPDYGDGLRISVGTDADIDLLFSHLHDILN